MKGWFSVKKFLVVVLVLSLFFGTGTTVAAIHQTIEYSEDDIVPQTIPLWLKVLGYVFRAVSNGIPGPATWKPQVTHYDYWVEVSSGSIKFNDGSDGFNEVFKELYGERDHSIYMYAHSHQLFWVGKIGLVLRDPNGVRRINQTVGHRQYAWYNIGNNIGYYEACYNTTNKHKWTLLIDYHYPLWPFESENFSGEKKYADIDGRRYLLPSKQHANSSFPELQGNKNNTITMSELYDQFYDTNQHLLVDAAKDFKAGDRIYINDCILDVHYNDEEDATAFMFSNKEEFTEIHFSGDLSQQFKAGDNINLAFRLLPICEEHNLVILDYNKLIIEQDIAPDISQFIIH